MPEQLLKAVQELNKTVSKLEQTLQQYPKRREVENRFTTKADAERKRRHAFRIGLTMLLVGLGASYFVTISTITSCFISQEARLGEAGQACHLLPGYTDAQNENQRRLDQFEELLNRPSNNHERLDRIEDRLGLPPLPDEGNNDE